MIKQISNNYFDSNHFDFIFCCSSLFVASIIDAKLMQDAPDLEMALGFALGIAFRDGFAFIV